MNRSHSKKTNEQQAIEQLQSRFDDLSHQRTRIGTQREAAQKNLQELQARAIKEFGTDVLAELEKKLHAMKLDNEKKRAEYQACLEKIEHDLNEVEAKYAARDASVGEG